MAFFQLRSPRACLAEGGSFSKRPREIGNGCLRVLNILGMYILALLQVTMGWVERFGLVVPTFIGVVDQEWIVRVDQSLEVE